jgi:hypothetical protein
MTRRTRELTVAVAAALASLGAGSAHATWQSYTDLQLFQDGLAAAGLTSILHDFDDATAGTNLRDATVDGITFSNFSLNRGFEPIISSESTGGFSSGNTISSPNAIGTSDDDFNQKFGNPDGFTIRFASSFAIGMWFLTTQPEAIVFAGDMVVTTTRASAGNGESVPAENKFNGGADGTSTSGVDGYFVGIIDTVPFEEATISSITPDQFVAENAIQFRIDNVYTAEAPAPTSLALLALGAGLIGLQRRRSPKRG